MRLARLAFLAMPGCDACTVADSGATETGQMETGGYTWVPCADPEPILDPTGAPTGWVLCADGSVDRVEAVPVDMASYEVPECSVPDDPGYCRTDADCTARPNGQCTTWYWGSGPFCGCTYLCSVDADCDEGQACVPPDVLPRWTDETWPVCREAACLTGADCASGECGYAHCADVILLCSAGSTRVNGLACRSGEDECRSGDDCRYDNFCLSVDGRWVCRTCADPS